ncbi:MAG: hypothetical protein ABC550_05730 [Candidatus Methanosuratincola petrocarbonis]
MPGDFDTGAGDAREERGNRIWKNSFVDPSASLSEGTILDGDFIYVAPFVETKGEVSIGGGSNLQDGVRVEGPAEIGSLVSLAHRAEIIASRIGDFSFVGFNAKVARSVVKAGCFIGHGARIEGMVLEEGSYVPPGGTGSAGSVDEALTAFKEEVLEVNAELALGYVDLFSDLDGKFGMVSPSPKTGWSDHPAIPKADKVTIKGRARIIGYVEFKGRAEVGDRASIRGDEGFPLVIGDGTRIGSGVVFHSLKGHGIEVGTGATIGDCTVVHGPAKIGDGARIGRGCTLLKCEIDDGVEVEDGTLLIERRATKKGIISLKK